MADLSSLIRLHKHELDEKQREIGLLYERLTKLENHKAALREKREEEIRLANENPETVSYTLSGFLEKSRLQEEEATGKIFALNQQIEELRDEMLESFAELKKFELTQNERRRLEQRERNLKEGRMFDEIAISSFMRREGEES